MDSWKVDASTTAFVCDDKEKDLMLTQGGKLVGKELNSRRSIIWIEDKKLKNLFN